MATGNYPVAGISLIVQIVRHSLGEVKRANCKIFNDFFRLFFAAFSLFGDAAFVIFGE